QEMDHRSNEAQEKASYLATLSQEYSLGEERQKGLREELRLKEEEIAALANLLTTLLKECHDSEEAQRKLSSRLHSLREIDSQLEWSESGVSALRDADKALV